MFALDVGQHQRAGDAVQQHPPMEAPPRLLLKPSVPGRADVGALGNFFLRSPDVRLRPTSKPKRSRIAAGAAILQ